MCTFEGYTGVHTCRECTRGGGVSIFYDNQFTGDRIVELCMCNITIETCVCRVNFEGGYLVILGVYRPHTDSIQNFILILESILNNPILRDASMVIVAGDMNVDICDIECTQTENYLSLLHSLNFLPVITRPTRFSNNIVNDTSSNLDHIWINKLNPFFSGILCMDISDHCPTFINFFQQLNSINSDKKHLFKFRPFSEKNLNSLRDELCGKDWNEVFHNGITDTGVHEACDKFVSYLDDVYCKYFPLKTKFISEKRLCKPWLSPRLKKLIDKKSHYFKLFRLGLISKVTNNIYKNQVNISIRRAKNLYFLNAFNEAKTNMRKSWNLIRNLLGSDSKKQAIKKISVGGHEFVEASDIAEQFNNFFCSVAEDLASQLPPPSQPHSNFFTTPYPNNFYIFDLTVSECNNIISKLKLTKSNVNSMPVKIFKLLSKIISPPLCKLINFSFRTGTFPNSFKIARITPIFKKGDRQNPNSYRPISSLHFISKIFERSMANKLFSFLKKFSILHPFQFGFQRNKSTCDALIHLTEFIYNSLDNKKTVVNVLIDLRKAFDSVNHEVLLDKMFIYGIRGLPLEWFKSYLSDRKQFVAVGSSRSSLKTTNIGVPQGSILGPILFLLFVNDLPNSTDILLPTLFADDTTLSISHHNYNEIVPILNRELDSVLNWTVSNKLSLNVEKTEMVIVSNKKTTHSNNQIMLGGEFIEYNDECVFLGVKIDNRLNFSNHIKYVANKLSKNTGIFYRIKDNMTKQARISYYYSLFFPYISYNVIVWGGTYKNHLYPIIRQQKRIIRLIADADYQFHTNSLFLKFEILKFEDVYKFFISVYMFKALQQGLFSNSHNLNTRNSNLATASFHRLTSTQHSVSFSGPKIWNSLPSNIRNINSLPSFKLKLKQYFINQYNS